MNRAQNLMKVVAALTIALTVSTCAKEQAAQDFKFTVVLFDHKDNQAVLQGYIESEHFDMWFKKDYPVGGDRIETPRDAVSFGTLVLTDGDSLLVMPLYSWGIGRLKYYACQSHEIGRAPMFSVLEETEKAFFQKMKARLSKIGNLTTDVLTK